jgi:hypothetical protein
VDRARRIDPFARPRGMTAFCAKLPLTPWARQSADYTDKSPYRPRRPIGHLATSRTR